MRKNCQLLSHLVPDSKLTVTDSNLPVINFCKKKEPANLQLQLGGSHVQSSDAHAHLFLWEDTHHPLKQVQPARRLI